MPSLSARRTPSRDAVRAAPDADRIAPGRTFLPAGTNHGAWLARDLVVDMSGSVRRGPRAVRVGKVDPDERHRSARPPDRGEVAAGRCRLRRARLQQIGPDPQSTDWPRFPGLSSAGTAF